MTRFVRRLKDRFSRTVHGNTWVSAGIGCRRFSAAHVLLLCAVTGCAGDRCEKVKAPVDLPITGRAVLEMRVRNAMSGQYELMGAHASLWTAQKSASL